jgi:hypothetical protein
VIYAVRHQGKQWTLVELKSMKALEALDDGRDYTPVTAWWARDWVRGGGNHETGLFINEGGKVRYATPCP